MNFPEAVRFLAEKCGIEIPENYDPELEKKQDVFKTLDQAARFYSANLLNAKTGKEARDYLKNRKITSETISAFRLGLAPDSWDGLTSRLGTSTDSIKLLERSGLVKPRTSGSGFYDTFRYRLMIPILDVHGRVAGFGGRVLRADDEPKYLNSPEGETFNKRKMLFNFRQALPNIRRLNSAIVVEGYLDVISLAQNGIKNVVATLGTAVTPEQMHMLARNCATVYFCYDADTAGQRATLRAISLQKDTPLDARIISFADPKDDPDTFVTREGPENFKILLENAQDIYTFLIETHTRGLKPPLEIPVKEKLIQEFKEFVPSIQSSIARSEVIRKISKLLDMDPFILEKEFEGKEAPQSHDNLRKRNLVSPNLNAEIKGQEWVLKHLLEHPEELDRVRALLGPDDFSDTRLRSIFEAISFQQDAAGGSLKPAEILATLDDSELISRLSELITSLEDRSPEPFMQCVKTLVEKRLKHEAEFLQKRIVAAEKRGDEAEIAQLMQEQFQLKLKKEVLRNNT